LHNSSFKIGEINQSIHQSINRVSVVSSTRDAAKQGFCVPPLPSVHSGQSYETQSAAAIQ
jgi:hypothetical protein